MHRMIWLTIICFVGFSAWVEAKEIEGVVIPDAATVGANQQLVLNGAGVRTKLFFDIYIGALYLTEKVSNLENIVSDDNPKRVLMHFLYDEVTAEKIVKGWNDGFKNNSAEQFETLQSRLHSFNQLFSTVHEGDNIILDFLPGQGTIVTINNEKKGAIEGKDFYVALLKVWLGEKPADDDLKEAMLGK